MNRLISGLVSASPETRRLLSAMILVIPVLLLSSCSGNHNVIAGSATASINLSLGVNQSTGLAINVNLGNSLTLSNQTVTAVNLGASSVFSAAILPPASTATDLASGQLSHIDDVLGVVSNVASSR